MHTIQAFLTVVLCGFVWLTIILRLALPEEVRIYNKDWRLKERIQAGPIYDRDWRMKGRIGAKQTGQVVAMVNKLGDGSPRIRPRKIPKCSRTI